MEPLPWPNSHVAERHQAEIVSGGDIGDAHQFNNGVMELTAVSVLFVAMKYSLPRKLKEATPGAAIALTAHSPPPRGSSPMPPHGEVRVENVAGW